MRAPIVLESPYARMPEQALAYVGLCTLVLSGLGWAAYASHAHLTSFLDDSEPVDRELGIELGFDIGAAIPRTVFALDLGVSPGMADAWARAMEDPDRDVYQLRLTPLILPLHLRPTEAFDQALLAMRSSPAPDEALRVLAIGAEFKAAKVRQFSDVGAPGAGSAEVH